MVGYELAEFVGGPLEGFPVPGDFDAVHPHGRWVTARTDSIYKRDDRTGTWLFCGIQGEWEVEL